MNVVDDLKGVKRLLARALRGKQLVWLGRKAYDAEGLAELTGQRVLIFAADRGEELGSFADPDSVVTMQDDVRQDWDTGELVKWFSTPRIVRKLIAKCDGLQPVIFPYQSNAELEKLCFAYGWELLAPAMDVKRQFQDKLRLMNVLRKLGLPALGDKGVIGDIQRISYPGLLAMFGERFVVQYPLGSGGNATFLVQSDEDLTHAAAKADQYGKQVQVTPFLNGVSPNINFVTTRYGTIVAPASEQIIGVASCGRESFSYNGNQWGTVPKDQAVSLYQQLKVLGNFMWQCGYRGIAGADAIRNYLLEVNTRVNNSTQTITRLCLNAGIIPPIAFHLLELLQVNYEFDLQSYQQQLYQLQWRNYQLILHNTATEPIQVGTALQPGIYRLGSNLQLQFVRPAYRLGKLSNNDFLLTSGVPQGGLCIGSDATILKIMGQQPIYKSGDFELTRYGEAIVSAVKSALHIVQLQSVNQSQGVI